MHTVQAAIQTMQVNKSFTLVMCSVRLMLEDKGFEPMNTVIISSIRPILQFSVIIFTLPVHFI